ncbi:MAG: hydantoinase/oxoprolinase family protein [Vulcanimicrobiaceae bacterium]
MLVPLDRDDVARAVATIRERGIAAVAVGLLHADVDGTHERIIADALRAAAPEIDVSLSSDVDPQYREYERFSTTVVNAALTPIVRAYLERIAAGLRERSVGAPAFIMRSDGGMTALEHAARRPAALIESGPASGVIAAAFVGRALGLENVLSFDMGGTTAKAGKIVAGRPEIGTSYEAAGGTHSGRAVRGSGYPVRFPFVELAEVSAGGGTIAWLDRAGTLRVGPLSAGADPGPAAYGSGDRPTVTDANVVLRRLNPSALLGGAFPISAERAHAAVATVARPLGDDVARTAAGIVTLVDHAMAKVLRIVSVERGYDPRAFTVLAFGGGGPLHACSVADEIGATQIVVPPHPGVFSAYGLLAADVRAVAVRSLVAAATADAFARAGTWFAELTRDVDATLAAQAVAPGARRFVRELDLRYAGQSTELAVDDVTSLAAALAAFHRKHRERYGFAVEEEPVEIVTVRIVGIGTTVKPPLVAAALPAPGAAAGRPGPAARAAERTAFDGTNFVAMPVYARAGLRPGDAFAGPAIVEQYDATTYVAPAWHARVDGFTNLVLEHRR